jgi:[ribosomal protein S5]-alanine N-acetyltransferase
VIKGELVNLRAVDRHDAPDIYRWLNNPEVMRYWGMPSSCPSLSRVQHLIEEWLEAEARTSLPQVLVVESFEAKSTGFVQFGEYKPNARSLELSVLIGDPGQWGRGLGSDVLDTVITTCFDDWGLRRIWVRSEAANERAQRMFTRLGFIHEATLRDASFFDGSFHDVLVFGLLRSEFDER